MSIKTMTVAEYKAALASNPRKVAGRANNHTELVKAIVKRLNLISGVDAIPFNTGGTETKSGGFIRFGFPGMADVYCRVERWIRIAGDDEINASYRNDATIWFEVKTGTGRPSAVQVAFKELAERWGDRYVIVRSVTDAEKAVGEIIS